MLASTTGTAQRAEFDLVLERAIGPAKQRQVNGSAVSDGLRLQSS
jgi:hypothetical protein